MTATRQAIKRAASPILNKSINMTNERAGMIQKWVEEKAKLKWGPSKIRREAFRNFQIKVTFS